MKKTDFLEIIKTEGLALRMIPLEETGRFDAIHYENAMKYKKENETIGTPYEVTLENGTKRRFFNVKTVPKNAGFWLCKKSESHMTSPCFWQDAFKSDTLEKSVLLYMRAKQA